MAKVEITGDLDTECLMEWAAGCPSLPKQSRPGDPFGQPPLVVHEEGDFFVQALTWMDGTTAVHQHGFAGAFMVVQGASLHVKHTFTQGERLAEGRLIVGELLPSPPEVLRPLDIRRIDPGMDFIHALFHLEMPTLTVVVRNASCGLGQPQYSYRRPGLGWDGLWQDRTWSRRVQCLDTLHRLDPSAGRRAVQELVASEPLWEAFCLVDHWFGRHGWDDFTAGLVDRLSGRAKPLENLLAAAFAHDAYVRRILARRGMLHALHQRVLLALLANLSDSAAIADVLRQLFPGDTPAGLLMDWLEELSSPSMRGLSGLAVAPVRLAELRSTAIDGHEHQVLLEMGSAWGGSALTIPKPVSL